MKKKLTKYDYLDKQLIDQKVEEQIRRDIKEKLNELCKLIEKLKSILSRKRN